MRCAHCGHAQSVIPSVGWWAGWWGHDLVAARCTARTTGTQGGRPAAAGPRRAVAARVHWPPTTGGPVVRPLLVVLPATGADALWATVSALTGVVVLAVSDTRVTRVADEAALAEATTALQWAADHADELHADPGRLLVGGEGPGAWLAAAVALEARDDGWPSVVESGPGGDDDVGHRGGCGPVGPTATGAVARRCRPGDRGHDRRRPARGRCTPLRLTAPGRRGPRRRAPSRRSCSRAWPTAWRRRSGGPSAARARGRHDDDRDNDDRPRSARLGRPAECRQPGPGRPRPPPRAPSRRADSVLRRSVAVPRRGGGRGAGDAHPGVARVRPLSGRVLAADVAVPHRRERVHRRAEVAAATGTPHGSRCRAGVRNRGRLAAPVGPEGRARSATLGSRPSLTKQVTPPTRSRRATPSGWPSSGCSTFRPDNGRSWCCARCCGGRRPRWPICWARPSRRSRAPCSGRERGWRPSRRAVRAGPSGTGRSPTTCLPSTSTPSTDCDVGSLVSLLRRAAAGGPADTGIRVG